MKKLLFCICAMCLLAACTGKLQTTKAVEVEEVAVSQPVLAEEKAHRSMAYDSSVNNFSSGVSMKRVGIVPPGRIMPYPAPAPDYNSMNEEEYNRYINNAFKSTKTDPLSTFSADVDTASFSIVKREISRGNKPSADSVRIEELINYFDYDYPAPKGKESITISTEYSDSPWNKDHKLVKIGVKAKEIEKEKIPASNLVFLIDVSGSMYSYNRLPLIQKSFKLLVDELRPQDKVSIVTYASGVKEVLSGVSGSEKEKIMEAINGLKASGGTRGSEGLDKAYEVAKKNFIKKGNNRIILATDGDFNIGPTSKNALEDQITKLRGEGVFLSVLGYGMGNYKDSRVQDLANKGNGNYAYINDLFEAKKVLVTEFGATLFTVAKDVKLQVEFNPKNVAAYRLVGYEKRLLNNEDFNDDAKDAGEMGAGHTTTVLYEIIPVGVKSKFLPDINDLKYAGDKNTTEDEILTVSLRYKEPKEDTSKLIKKSLRKEDYKKLSEASDDFRFAASVAAFGQILKDSEYKGDIGTKEVTQSAKKAKGQDDSGYRADFIRLMELYETLK